MTGKSQRSCEVQIKMASRKIKRQRYRTFYEEDLRGHELWKRIQFTREDFKQ